MKALDQQINLYQTNFRKTRVKFSAMRVLQISIIFCVALAGLSVYTQKATHPLRERSLALENQVVELESRVETLRQAQSPEHTQMMEDNIVRLKRERTEKQRVLGNMGQQDEFKNRLFSSYFEGLARRTLDGLWLEDIRVDSGGQSIRITGNTRDAELIPVWIKSLQSEEAFVGVRFRSAKLESVEETDRYLKFSLQTHEQAEEELP
ncbi:MAG: PilN domain-containing protein [Pseudomonadota bacterium]